MRRRYTGADFRRLVEQLRKSRPDIAITTDLIVGFPGETDADFEHTLALVREVRFVDSFSFKYSPRPRTAAAGFDGAVPAAEAQARLEALQDLQRSLTLDYHRTRVGDGARVLVEGGSRRGGRQLRGRDPYHRVVNFAARADGDPVPGQFAAVSIAEATPHSLIGELLGARDLLSTVKPGAGRADVAGRSAAAVG